MVEGLSPTPPQVRLAGTTLTHYPGQITQSQRCACAPRRSGRSGFPKRINSSFRRGLLGPVCKAEASRPGKDNPNPLGRLSHPGGWVEDRPGLSNLSPLTRR